MNCPFCNEEMEHGYLKSYYNVYFDMDKSHTPRVARHKGQWITNDNKPRNHSIEAWFCHRCKRIIIENVF